MQLWRNWEIGRTWVVDLSGMFFCQGLGMAGVGAGSADNGIWAPSAFYLLSEDQGQVGFFPDIVLIWKWLQLCQVQKMLFSLWTFEET